MANNNTIKTTELLVVTRNELGTFVRMIAPLAQNDINIECYCGYEWGNEAAFRLITDNNKKAREILTKSGWQVSESPAVLWKAPNKPGTLRRATSALAEQKINIYASYSAAQPGDKSCMVAFTTSDTNKTLETLKKI